MVLKKNIQIDKKLNNLFYELRVKKKIIDPEIKLIPYYRTLNFQGLNLFNIRKRIRYNPDFYKEMSKYPDDYTLFLLLHEAGHIAEKTLFRIENIIYTIAILGGITTLVVWVIYRSVTFFIIVLCLTIFILWAALILSFSKQKASEYFADEFALKNFIQNFSTNDICNFVEKFFCILDKISNDPRFKLNDDQKLLMNIFYLGRDYHPRDEERINRLISLVKCK